MHRGHLICCHIIFTACEVRRECGAKCSYFVASLFDQQVYLARLLVRIDRLFLICFLVSVPLRRGPVHCPVPTGIWVSLNELQQFAQKTTCSTPKRPTARTRFCCTTRLGACGGERHHVVEPCPQAIPGATVETSTEEPSRNPWPWGTGTRIGGPLPITHCGCQHRHDLKHAVGSSNGEEATHRPWTDHQVCILAWRCRFHASLVLLLPTGVAKFKMAISNRQSLHLEIT